MEACNEFAVMMERRAQASQESEIKRLTEEPKVAKEEKKIQARTFICLKDEWKRAGHEKQLLRAKSILKGLGSPSSRSSEIKISDRLPVLLVVR